MWNLRAIFCVGCRRIYILHILPWRHCSVCHRIKHLIRLTIHEIYQLPIYYVHSMRSACHIYRTLNIAFHIHVIVYVCLVFSAAVHLPVWIIINNHRLSGIILYTNVYTYTASATHLFSYSFKIDVQSFAFRWIISFSHTMPSMQQQYDWCRETNQRVTKFWSLVFNATRMTNI